MNLGKVALKSLISHQNQTGGNAADLNERERMIYGWVGKQYRAWLNPFP